MKTRLTWLLILMLALSVFWGCSDDDDDDPVVPQPTDFEVMAAAGAEYINDALDCPGVYSAAALNDALNVVPALSITVIDLRSQEHYDGGHIPGAVKSSTTDLIADLADGTIPVADTYVVACYSGQEAGHAKIAMELLGYEDVKTLLFGMSAWSTDFVDANDFAMDRWTGGCGDNIEAVDVVNNNGDLVENDFPVIAGTVEERVATMLSAGFQALSYDQFKAIPSDQVFVINYFGEADYMPGGASGVPGHIEGAFQFTPYASLGIDQVLDQIPTDKTVVVYCWTGQHSSQITAYLNMLGYQAKSLKYGSNHLFHTDLTAHKWTEAAHGDYPLEVTETLMASGF